MEQCYSGGFIDNLQGNNRVIATACNCSETSSAMPPDYNYDEFVYYWTSAVAGETPDGTPVDADVNHDNFVSMSEAFNYASAHDTRPETPQYSSTPSDLGNYLSLYGLFSLLTITGPSLVCTSNSTFTLNNRPSGTTVSWIHSDHLVYVSGQGTDNYTVRAASSTAIGVGWVKAIVSNSCGNNTLEKTVWVGKPITPIIFCPFNVVGMNSLIEVLAASPGADNYTWSVGGGTITSGQGTSDIWIMTSSHCLYDLTIRLTTSNSCGSSAQTMKSVPFDCSGGVNPLSVSPNPASQTITVELKDTPATATTEKANEGFTVKLLNSYNKPVYQKKVKSKRFTINVSRYRAGIYYLRVIKGNKLYTKKVVITK